jgi:hypothetical protein
MGSWGTYRGRPVRGEVRALQVPKRHRFHGVIIQTTGRGPKIYYSIPRYGSPEGGQDLHGESTPRSLPSPPFGWR